MAENLKRSVLIIESDEVIRDNLKHRFSKRGMLVITAKDGYEGYVRACNENPDLIIIESLLSSMSGFRMMKGTCLIRSLKYPRSIALLSSMTSFLPQKQVLA